ncbi:MAG: outer membrane beta-barrel protein, partial [Bacteroidota bacterium]
DLHFRNQAAHPLYMDLSVGAWYTKNNFERNTDLTNFDLKKAETWAVIIPVTIGVSVAPLPDNPIQPYAMAGLGAYIGISGRDDIMQLSEQNKSASETVVAFGYYLGAGLDFMFAETFGISVGAKYQFIEFKDPLKTGQKNLTGLQASVGIAMMI